MRHLVLHSFFRLFVIATCAALAPALSAEDIYVAQTARGTGTGRDVANAHSVAFFNTASNWNSPTKITGKIGPGDIVHLVGTITTALTVHASGVEGKAITILFDPGAKMTASYWSGAAIKVPRRDYITIDGGATGTIGGPGGDNRLTNGLIECTDNGTIRRYQVNSSGVSGTECNHFTVKNLVVSNMYVRTRGSEQKSYGAGISNANTNGHGISYFTVENCIIHDAYIGVNSDYGKGDNNYEFSYITVYNCNWGGRCGDRGPGSTMDGLSVHHNRFYNWTNWDDTERNAFHHNGFFAWAMSGGVLIDVRFYANQIGPNYSLVKAGEASRANHSTSGIYVQGRIRDLIVYNNVFIGNSNDAPANGFLTVRPEGDFSDVGIYNNTFKGSGTGRAIYIGQGNGVYTVKNNLAMDVGTFISSSYAYSSRLVADYNLGYGLLVRQEYSYSISPSGNSNFKTFEQWQSMGYDVHGSNQNPHLDNNLIPRVGSFAIAAAADLSALFATDSAGSVRPKGQAWTIGAFQPPSGITGVNQMVAPKIIKQPLGQTLLSGSPLTLTITVSGTPVPTYQWYRNGAALSGQTGATLKLTSVTTASAGTYTVVVKNSAGSVTSKGAVVTVQVPPAITTQPRSQTVAAGATATLTVSASGNPSPKYQWKKNGAAISGATAASLKLSSVTAAQSGSYTVVATNAAGSATSNAAVLTVKAATVSPPPQTTPVTGADSGSGQVTTPPATTAPGRFANLSVRAAPGTDSSSLIVGFVAASAKKRILVRAVGPGLEAMTHLKTFADPQLTLYAGSAVMANNAQWGGTPLLRDTFTAVGAFPLDNKSMDAAILSTLAPQAYTAVVSGTGTGVVLAEIYDADSVPTSSAGRLVNLSARAHVGTGDNVLIAGFVIAGSSPVKVLIRAVGPSLSKVGVSGALVDPLLELYRGETRLTQNDNWGGSSTLTAAFTQTGAFGLANASSKDAAILVTLDPGAYTAVVSGVKGTTGNALVEAYEVR